MISFNLSFFRNTEDQRAKWFTEGHTALIRRWKPALATIYMTYLCALYPDQNKKLMYIVGHHLPTRKSASVNEEYYKILPYKGVITARDFCQKYIRIGNTLKEMAKTQYDE